MSDSKLKLLIANARWVVLALATIWVAFLCLMDPCSERPAYGLVALAASTAVVLLWKNHIRLLAAPPRRRALRIAAGFAIDAMALVFLVAAGTFPFVMVMSTVDCYTPRTRVSEAFILADSAQAQIAEHVKQSGTLAGSGKGVTLAVPGKWVDGGYVSENGTVVITTSDPPAFIVLTPHLANGLVAWDCAGFP
ncbi:MAG: pilin, partial [Nevskia sp.]|nr:pilin [Nevskia sp.]